MIKEQTNQAMNCEQANGKHTYEKPELDVIEFELSESIAASGAAGYSTFCGEEVF